MVSVPIPAAFAGVALFLTLRCLSPAQPIQLRGPGLSLSSPHIAAGPRGHAIAVWAEEGVVIARMLVPRGEWGPTLPISEPGEFPPLTIGAAIAADGTAIVAWRQFIGGLMNGLAAYQIIARKFVPGVGWSPQQVLSTRGQDASVAMASDGRAHIFIYEIDAHGQWGLEPGDRGGWVVRTLGPGEDSWSETVLLRVSGGTKAPRFVAGHGFAYAAFGWYTLAPFAQGVQLAEYTADGWRPGAVISDPAKSAGDPQLVTNNGHIVVSWIEFGQPATQWVQRLTSPGDRFVAPRPPFTRSEEVGCRLTLLPNGSVLAVCAVPGEADFSCSTLPGFNCSIEGYHRSLTGDWVGPELLLEDPQRRGFLLQMAADTLGNALVLWRSNIPGQLGVEDEQLSSRIWTSATNSWQPETVLATGRTDDPASDNVTTRFYDLAVDGLGTFRPLWTTVDLPPVPAGVLYSLFTEEIRASATQPGDVNGDGTVNCDDLSIVRSSLGKRTGEAGFDVRADTNQDGVVDIKDMAFVAQQLPPDTQCP